MKTIIFLFSATLSLFLFSCSSQETADIVFTNGKVYTVNEAQPWADAVAVKDNKIVFVGSSDDVKAYIGENTEQTDLAGKMMMPGFVDAHLHPFAGSFIARGVDLQTDNRDELFDLIKDYAAANPDLKVITGYGWRFNVWTDRNPTRQELDAIETERPIFLWAIDGHAAWVNTKALEVAGITKDSPDTQAPYSYYFREKDGTPTGYIMEIPAQLEVFTKLVDLNEEYILSGLDEWLPKFSSVGITTMVDYGIQGVSIEEGYAMYQDLEKSGELPTRVYGTYYWNNPKIDPIPELLKLHESVNSELVKMINLKINLDGGDDKANALFVEPYTDNPNLKIDPIIPKDLLFKVVKKIDSLGIDYSAHCFGDGAVRLMLDATEAAIEINPPHERRNTISHNMLVHKNDIERIVKLGVIADYQMGWGAWDPLLENISLKRLGSERMDRVIGAKEILEKGGHVSFSSDWPVSGYLSNYNPLLSIQTAITRQPLGMPDKKPLGGDKAKFTLAEGLYAHTMGSAYSIRMEKQIGSIETGKKADLIILDKNLFDVAKNNVYELHKTKVVMTMMNGKVVYKSN